MLHRYGAAQVICTWRTKPMGFKWPSNVGDMMFNTLIWGANLFKKFIELNGTWWQAEERPLVQRFDGKVATFKVFNRLTQKYKYKRHTLSFSLSNPPILYLSSLCFIFHFTLNLKDGSTAEVDVIMMCTGYLHSYPFLRLDIFQNSFFIWHLILPGRSWGWSAKTCSTHQGSTRWLTLLWSACSGPI